MTQPDGNVTINAVIATSTAHIPKTTVQDLRPGNYDEIEAVIDLIWGDHPELETLGDIRRASNELLREMRRADGHSTCPDDGCDDASCDSCGHYFMGDDW